MGKGDGGKSVVGLTNLLGLGNLSLQVGNDLWWDSLKGLTEVSVVNSVVSSQLEVGNLLSREGPVNLGSSRDQAHLLSLFHSLIKVLGEGESHGSDNHDGQDDKNGTHLD